MMTSSHEDAPHADPVDRENLLAEATTLLAAGK